MAGFPCNGRGTLHQVRTCLYFAGTNMPQVESIAMDTGVDDVFRNVEYIRDKWIMNRVPRALFGCCAGLAVVAFTDPRPPSVVPVVMLVVMLLIGMAGMLVHVAISRLFDAGPLWVGVGVLLVVLLAIFLVTGSSFRTRPSSLPPAVFGWIGVYLGVGYIAYALSRHFYYPSRPVVMLSTAGITIQTPATVLIPWHEIERIGPLELGRSTGFPNRFPDVTTLTLDTEFYERQILPKKRNAPNWDAMFYPEEKQTQVALPHPLWLGIDAKDIRDPVEARWKAFRDRRDVGTSVPQTKAAPPRGPTQVYGRWAADGSIWQRISFLVPLAGVLGLTFALIARWLY
jgi:hypothetical protein